jgi:hypothetical protein
MKPSSESCQIHNILITKGLFIDIEEADDFLCLNVAIPAFGKGKYRLF